MSALSRKEPIFLFVGDIAIFFVSLWLTLLIRYGVRPQGEVWDSHIVPFSILFLVWFVVFYIAGLYEKRSVILKGHLPATILKVQVINSIIAVVFFYFIPYYGIAPKTNLFIYLVVSFVLISLWRLGGYMLLGSGRQRQRALIIGSGPEMSELVSELNAHTHYSVASASVIDVSEGDPRTLSEKIQKEISEKQIDVVVADADNPKLWPLLPSLYNLAFSGIAFIDMHKLYEDIFDRIPLSMVTHGWFLENISLAPKFTYDFLKRIMDLIAGLCLGLISLIFYPFVYIAIKLDDGGPIFFIQERVGKNNAIIKNIKFRTMSVHNEKDGLAKSAVPTRIGPFLRRSRIDELPQLLNVIKGDISLIGPRPEIPVLVRVYEYEIPYYNARHLIKPGLSGWAQLYQKDPPKSAANADKTKIKLSYDLYYIKNRSFWLDIKIALKTVRDLLSRNGI